MEQHCMRALQSLPGDSRAEYFRGYRTFVLAKGSLLSQFSATVMKIFSAIPYR